jgi:putative flippase GtrA
VKSLIARHRRKIDYLLVGGVNTAIGLGAFPALYFLATPYQLHYMIVLVISQIFCVTVAFFTNKHFVFRTRGNYLTEYLRFSAFYWGYFTFNLILMPLLVEIFGINPVVSQVPISAGIILISYFWHSKVTFVSNKRVSRRG